MKKEVKKINYDDIHLSLEEYTILKTLNKKFKWIQRDSATSSFGSYLWAGTHKPVKSVNKDGWKFDRKIWVFTYEDLDKSEDYELKFPGLFKFVKWSDPEPYSIKKLIKTYEKHMGLDDIWSMKDADSPKVYYTGILGRKY